MAKEPVKHILVINLRDGAMSGAEDVEELQELVGAITYQLKCSPFTFDIHVDGELHSEQQMP